MAVIHIHVANCLGIPNAQDNFRTAIDKTRLVFIVDVSCWLNDHVALPVYESPTETPFDSAATDERGKPFTKIAGVFFEPWPDRKSTGLVNVPVPTRRLSDSA